MFKKIYPVLILLSVFFLAGCSSDLSNEKKENIKEIKKEIKIENKCTYDTDDKCDKRCTKDADCKPLTPKVCINREENNESEPIISFYYLPNCKCENKKCVVVE